MKVKICGLRRDIDILYVNDYKPDYVGFILAPSKRQIDILMLKKFISSLNPQIVPVGVFVNQSISFIMEGVKAGLKVVQLHGDESPEFITILKSTLLIEDYDEVMIWKAFRVGSSVDFLSDKNTLSILESSEVNAVLLDAFSKDAYGGTGETFNWNIIGEFKNISSKPLFVAGGLTIDNVSELIDKTNPYGIDVSSGVETQGFKDKEKIKLFLKATNNLK